MIDHDIALQTLRARYSALTIATTGSTSLSATSTGYARAAGSFLTDDFRVGMEITEVTGYSGANNQATTSQGRVITAVTATALSCSGTTTESAGSGRVITAGLPFCRAWELTHFEPVVGFPYVADRFVPATQNLITFPANNGQAEETGLYVVTWFGLSGKGTSGIRKSVDALLARFTPGTALTMSDGDVVRVRSGLNQPGPQAGQIVPMEGNRAYCQVTIPWIARSTNLIAA